MCRSGTLWKGYICSELYFEGANHWLPIVLELTENLELDFRDRAKRGQVWRVWRLPIGKKHKSACQASLVEEQEPADWPQPFDFRSVLRHLYHVERLPESVTNPTPQPRPSLDELFAEVDAAPLDSDALFTVFDRMNEIRQRIQGRLGAAQDESAPTATCPLHLCS